MNRWQSRTNYRNCFTCSIWVFMRGKDKNIIKVQSAVIFIVFITTSNLYSLAVWRLCLINYARPRMRGFVREWNKWILNSSMWPWAMITITGWVRWVTHQRNLLSRLLASWSWMNGTTFSCNFISSSHSTKFSSAPKNEIGNQPFILLYWKGDGKHERTLFSSQVSPVFYSTGSQKINQLATINTLTLFQGLLLFLWRESGLTQLH